ncbi:hypothetical protein CPB84DRAFT_1779603 [Gymnopilus junonius]|uniref:Uncharacterized protein n=1 Tax=Gymnopilus junonius TaxID=109634 RepID=A0A9P5NPW0_GYMJU|nr:hypothetical protein CPB84DRAFT_1779603 [Gymnopilus junonius]
MMLKENRIATRLLSSEQTRFVLGLTSSTSGRHLLLFLTSPRGDRSLQAAFPGWLKKQRRMTGLTKCRTMRIPSRYHFRLQTIHSCVLVSQKKKHQLLLTQLEPPRLLLPLIDHPPARKSHNRVGNLVCKKRYRMRYITPNETMKKILRVVSLLALVLGANIEAF